MSFIYQTSICHGDLENKLSFLPLCMLVQVHMNFSPMVDIAQ